jgi:transcription elongation GreA/GreB family factor
MAKRNVLIITPESPLGRALPGEVCDNEIQVDQSGNRKACTVVAVA